MLLCSLLGILGTLVLLSGDTQICRKSQRIEKTHHLLLQSIELWFGPIAANGELIYIFKSGIYWFLIPQSRNYLKYS